MSPIPALFPRPTGPVSLKASPVAPYSSAAREPDGCLSRGIRKELQLALAQALDVHKDAILTFCQVLVRIASENPPGNRYRECTDRLSRNKVLPGRPRYSPAWSRPRSFSAWLTTSI
jgi:hypothetical protein